MQLTQDGQEIPVQITGSSSFGRYPTISAQRTYNMFLSTADANQQVWLVNYAGYKSVAEIIAQEGRGIFHSVRGGFMLVIVASAVYRINSLDTTPILVNPLLPLNNSTGEVFMDENISGQILIVNGTDTAYIYNHEANDFGIALMGGVSSSDLHPNYVTYQNTYFIVGNALTTPEGSQWFIFQADVATSDFALKKVTFLAIQSKPDFARAALRIPGAGNNILIFGETVTELWNNVAGLQIYQRSSSFNIDYGVLSVGTIAANDEYIAWLGSNEKSTPSIMAFKGNSAQRISTDGIDNLLASVKFPEQSTALFYRQDGHLFYQLTFFNAEDNFTIVYDFTTNLFFDLTDWDSTAHPARQVAYFNKQTYFVSYKIGNIYQFDTNLTTYQVTPSENTIYQIPRIRITDTYRMPSPEKFIVNLFTFIMESGTTFGTTEEPVCFGYILNEQNLRPIYMEDGVTPILLEGGYCISNQPRLDIAISKNGGISWSNTFSIDLKAAGDYVNQIRINRLGAAQQITFRLSFWGTGRFVIKNGKMEARV